MKLTRPILATVIAATALLGLAGPASAKPRDSITVNGSPVAGGYASFTTRDIHEENQPVEKRSLRIVLRCTQNGVQVYENLQPQTMGANENMALFGLHSATWDPTLPATCTADLQRGGPHHTDVIDASTTFTVAPA